MSDEIKGPRYERLLAQIRADLGITQPERVCSFEGDLRRLLNQHSAENSSDTPDFVMARYLLACLDAFNEATLERDKFRGERRTDTQTKPDLSPATLHQMLAELARRGYSGRITDHDGNSMRFRP